MTEEQIRERNIAIAKFLQLGNVGTGQIRYAVILEGKAVGYYLPEKLEVPQILGLANACYPTAI
jgi:hypothetical protein